MKDIRKTIIGVAILGVILVALDLAVGKSGEWMIKHLPDFGGQIVKDNYRMNRLVGDVVFVGSSRTDHHYAIPIIQDSLDAYCSTHHEAYNAGVDGRFIDLTCCVIESILERGKPSLIVMEASDEAWTNQDNAFDRGLLFYNSNQVFREYWNRKGLKERLMSKSNMYRFNGMIQRLAINIVQPSSKNDGYSPLFGVMKVLPKKKTAESVDTMQNEFSIDNFNRVLAKSKEKGCNIVVVASPRLGNEGKNVRTAAMCAEYGVPFIDMESIPYFNENPQLFQDAGHLNDSGARIFTSMFFTQLKPYLDF